MSATSRFVRPAAVAVSVLLLAGIVQAAPASAADQDPGFGIYANAVYPYAKVPGLLGQAPGEPADAGAAPGSVALSVRLDNYGVEALHGITVTPRVVTNGRVDSVRCATSPLFPDDVTLLDGVLQSESPPFPSPPAPSPGAPPPSWSDPDLALAPRKPLYCAVQISGITDQVVSEVDTTATAVGVKTGRSVTHDWRTWAAAGKLRPPAPGAVSIKGLAFFDRNDNGGIDGYTDEPEKNEPMIAGLRVTITGPDGKPVPNYRTGQGVVGPQTTDSDGNYTFADLRPYTSFYTVSVDLSSPALAGMAKRRDAFGELSPDRATWTQKVRTADVGFDANWSFVPKNLLYLTMNAPTSAIAGTRFTLTGRADRADTGAWAGPVVLEYVPPGGDWYDWTKVSDVTNDRGKLSVTLAATRSTYYRFRHLGGDGTSDAVSVVYRVSVFTAPVAFSASAPATAQQGKPLTITGTIKRAGQPFQTGRILLEFTLDNKAWATVAEVRSTAGVMSATVLATRTGSYRWHYLGDSKTSPGTSTNRRVVVTPATTRSASPRPPSTTPEASSSPSPTPR